VNRDWLHYRPDATELDGPASYYLVGGVDRDAVWSDVRRRCELGHTVQLHDHAAGAPCVRSCEKIRARTKHAPIATLK